MAQFTRCDRCKKETTTYAARPKRVDLIEGTQASVVIMVTAFSEYHNLCRECLLIGLKAPTEATYIYLPKAERITE